MWLRSPTSPSERSSAAVARPRSARPNVMRGVGKSSWSRHSASLASFNTSRPVRCITAAAAAPSEPETHTSSPACPPSRRKAAPGGTSPAICTAIVNGPRVVSPPINSSSCSSASAKKPSQNAATHASSMAGKAIDNVHQAGLAPMAARSERFTASALWPSRRGSTSAKKCRPSTSMSAEMASCMPGVGASSAQSSPTPSKARPLRLRRGRAKYRAISSNSFTSRN